MWKVSVVFQKRFNRSPLFGFVTVLPDFKSKSLTIYQDAQMRSAVIIRTSEVQHFEVINDGNPQKEHLCA